MIVSMGHWLRKLQTIPCDQSTLAQSQIGRGHVICCKVHLSLQEGDDSAAQHKEDLDAIHADVDSGSSKKHKLPVPIRLRQQELEDEEGNLSAVRSDQSDRIASQCKLPRALESRPNSDRRLDCTEVFS